MQEFLEAYKHILQLTDTAHALLSAILSRPHILMYENGLNIVALTPDNRAELMSTLNVISQQISRSLRELHLKGALNKQPHSKSHRYALNAKLFGSGDCREIIYQEITLCYTRKGKDITRHFQTRINYMNGSTEEIVLCP